MNISEKSLKISVIKGGFEQPVAIKSSNTSTLSPCLIAVLDMHSSSLPVAALYSLVYVEPDIAFGSLPAFLIMINGFFSARAIGGPKMNPLASRPAILSNPIGM